MVFLRIDYADPANRTFKVPMDGKVRGYTFKRMNSWIKKWDDPTATIRKSFRYRQVYMENYRYLFAIRNKRLSQQKFLLKGLDDCIDMLEKVQAMEQDDPYRKSFSWEAKCLFFAFFDFCEPPRKDIKISDRLKGRSTDYYGKD